MCHTTVCGRWNVVSAQMRKKPVDQGVVVPEGRCPRGGRLFGKDTCDTLRDWIVTSCGKANKASSRQRTAPLKCDRAGAAAREKQLNEQK